VVEANKVGQVQANQTIILLRVILLLMLAWELMVLAVAAAVQQVLLQRVLLVLQVAAMVLIPQQTLAAMETPTLAAAVAVVFALAQVQLPGLLAVQVIVALPIGVNYGENLRIYQKRQSRKYLGFC
jgi:lysylphosphatidylglycerol synthetase-like protein (DUF2156 family)